MVNEHLRIRAQPLVTRQQYLDLFAHPAMAEESARVLDEHEVFDKRQALWYDSKHMPLISLLGLYTHFSGTLFSAGTLDDGTPTKFQATLGDRIIPPVLLEAWTSCLGFQFCTQEKSYRFKEHGAPYARLLYLLGFSTSLESARNGKFNSKAERGAAFPSFLTRCESSYNQLGTSDKRMVRKYLRDLIQVCFQTTASFSQGESECALSLAAQRTPKLVRKNASFLFNAMRILYPALKTSLEDHFAMDKEHCLKLRSTYYTGRIAFSAEDIAKISTPENFFPIKQRLFLEPKFSLEYRRG